MRIENPDDGCEIANACPRAEVGGRPSPYEANEPAGRGYRRARRLARCGAGGVALEFALGLPVLLLMVYGIIEFGRALWAQNTLEYAVEEAVRYAIVNDGASKSDIINIAQNKVTGLNVDNIRFSVKYDRTNGSRSFVTVDAIYRFELLVPHVFVGPYDMNGSSRLPVVR